MSFKNQDIKLKNLIQVCKETGNLKKLAVVSFELTSRQLDEIGIKLGIRKREHESETLVEYMEMINQIFEKNISISIFSNYFIETIDECEPLFLRNRGVISYDSIRTMYKVYYELRKLDVPNLHRKLGDQDLVGISKYGFQSFLSPTSRRKRNNGSSTLQPLILQKIKEKQIDLQRQSKDTLNSYILEKAISLKKVQNSLNNKGKQNRIKFEGALKDNLSYQQSIENVVGYFIIGVFILLLTLGMSIFLKLMTYPDIPSSFSYWSLLFVGGGAILLVVYIKYFIRRRY